jgi:hypothetical protein
MQPAALLALPAEQRHTGALGCSVDGGAACADAAAIGRVWTMAPGWLLACWLRRCPRRRRCSSCGCNLRAWQLWPVALGPASM